MAGREPHFGNVKRLKRPSARREEGLMKFYAEHKAGRTISLAYQRCRKLPLASSKCGLWAHEMSPVSTRYRSRAASSTRLQREGSSIYPHARLVRQVGEVESDPASVPIIRSLLYARARTFASPPLCRTRILSFHTFHSLTHLIPTLLGRIIARF